MAIRRLPLLKRAESDRHSDRSDHAKIEETAAHSDPITSMNLQLKFGRSTRKLRDSPVRVSPLPPLQRRGVPPHPDPDVRPRLPPRGAGLSRAQAPGCEIFADLADDQGSLRSSAYARASHKAAPRSRDRARWSPHR